LTERRSSYQQILRATSIIGLASGINIVFQILRVKVLAVLLGPGGMGLFGLFQSIMTTASSLAGMGINSSAVRQIAAARGSGDDDRVGEVTYVFCILTIILGVIGGGTVFIFRNSIARWAFDDDEYSAQVGWLAIGVFLTVAGQSLTSLLQAYRLIGAQAWLQIWSGVLITALAISAIAWLGKDGIILFVIVAPFIILVLAWLFARRVCLIVKQVALRSFGTEARNLINLGFMIMVAGSLQASALLVIRSHITHDLGTEATGLFQAAWGLSFVYMGFVLDAMGKDFYPQLSEGIADKEKTIQLVREQINIALLLIGPLIISMIAFAPIIVDLLYARSFRDAAPIIQWMGVGNLLKLISWPLGYVVIAHARTRLFIFLEIVWVVTFLAVGWLLGESLGLIGIGVGFVIAYAVTLIAVFFSCRSLTDFRFDRDNLWLLLLYGTLIASAFFSANHDLIFGYVIGGALVLVSGAYSYHRVALMIGSDPIKLLWKKLFSSVGSGN
jgi:PST family polysaccharide transporter